MMPASYEVTRRNNLSIVYCLVCPHLGVLCKVGLLFQETGVSRSNLRVFCLRHMFQPQLLSQNFPKKWKIGKILAQKCPKNGQKLFFPKFSLSSRNYEWGLLAHLVYRKSVERIDKSWSQTLGIFRKWRKIYHLWQIRSLHSFRVERQVSPLQKLDKQDDNIPKNQKEI